MKKFRRITTLLLAVMLIAAMCVPAYADNGMTRAVIGADLNEDQVAAGIRPSAWSAAAASR